MNRLTVFFLLILGSLVGCRDAGDSRIIDPNPPPPPPSTSQVQTVVQADNNFTFDLFRQIARTQSGMSFFCSPFSVSLALGMTLNGADGTTYDSMRAVLGFSSLQRSEINSSYQTLSSYLRSVDSRVALQIANSIWYRSEFSVEQSFIDVNKTSFDAEVASLDFALASALPTINGWVNTKTNGLIPTILDAIPSNAVMYLINALYFKGQWTTKFDNAKTQDDVFTSSTGSRVPCKMMNLHTDLPYAEQNGTRAVDLGYGNGRYSMTVILPPPGSSIGSFAAAFTRLEYDALVARFDSTDVTLSMPRFTMTSSRSLASDLGSLGMGIAFDPTRANFQRINSTAQLYISNVIHKAYVAVDEEGTEAAAVTSVEIGVTSIGTTQSIRVDRPFLFVIRERGTGVILFIGKAETI